MNIAGWTSVGWYERDGEDPMRRWKWHSRSDVLVVTNNDDVLFALAGTLSKIDAGEPTW